MLPVKFSILFSFQGIYTSVVYDKTFDQSWLLATFEIYAWGYVIVLVVNSIVYPQSSESELRELIVTSLTHVSTLSHLVCKTYEVAILDDEKVGLLWPASCFVLG